MQYADFAVWQRAWLQGEVLERELAYWRRQLAGAAAAPGAAHRPAAAGGAELPRRASRAGAPAGRARPAGCEALGRREGATLFMVLLAGFQALLARYSGQDDLAVGSPIAGPQPGGDRGADRVLRQHAGAARRPVAASPSFRELLGRVRETALAAYAHQDVPFEKLVEELAPERSLAHTPLFQVMLVLQNAPAESLEIRACACGRWASERGRRRSSISRSALEERDGGLAGTARVRHRSVRRRDDRPADRPLRAAARGGRGRRRTGRVSELPLLSRGGAPPAAGRVERRRRAASRGAVAVHELFEAQAERTPDAVAVVCGGRGADLRASSTRGPTGWRATCGALGVGPEVPVGALRWSARRSWWSRCWASSRPAAPTCRSTRPTRRSAWPSCWRTPALPVAAHRGAAARPGCPADAGRDRAASIDLERPRSGAGAASAAPMPARRPRTWPT